MSDPATLQYLHGFGNEHESEALAGTLPVGQLSPQQACGCILNVAFYISYRRNRRAAERQEITG